MFVYLITNTINGKRYVGQTTQTLEERWSQHCASGGCCALNSEIKKHGAENFIIEAICEPPAEELMDEFEKEYIIRYNTLVPNGYNLMTGGAAPRHSIETRNKLSKAHTGKILSEEQKKKISQSLLGNTWNIGRHPSEETRAKLSEAGRGRKHTSETIKKMKLIQGNRSEDWLNKLSESAKGRVKRPIGFKHSEETKLKMSLAARGNKNGVGHTYVASDETKRKLSDAKKSWWKNRKLNSERPGPTD